VIITQGGGVNNSTRQKGETPDSSGFFVVADGSVMAIITVTGSNAGFVRVENEAD
jgi:hypothetical protein